MIKSISIKLTKPIFDAINPKDIIYAEIARPGAMGNDGGVMIYLIKDLQLICYETNINTDEKVYLLVEELLFKKQEEFINKDIEVAESLFNHFYGGAGNHTFINKDVREEEKYDWI